MELRWYVRIFHASKIQIRILNHLINIDLNINGGLALYSFFRKSIVNLISHDDYNNYILVELEI